MREVLFGCGFNFAVLALGLAGVSIVQLKAELHVIQAYLIGSAAGQAPERALDCASSLIKITLSGGGLVFVGRHVCESWVLDVVG